MPKKSLYRMVCWKQTYWLDTLWNPGEIYEGELKPGKYFREEDEEIPEEPIVEAGSDPRPNIELKKILKEKYGFKVPSSWKRRQIWARLREFEIAESKDAAPQAEPESYIAPCGFEARSQAGLVAHQRQCEKCKEAE